MIILCLFDYSFLNKNYGIDKSINITDWLNKPDLLPIDDNYDKLLKGFLETPGRIAQASYNFYVIFPHFTILKIIIV